MTAYATIPDGDIDPESPITTSLMTLLRDNPLAIQEGDASAPEVKGANLVLIETQTPSGVATVDFETGIDDTYDEYVIFISRIVPVTTGSELRCRVGAGSSYISTGTYTYTIDSIRPTATAYAAIGSNAGTYIIIAEDIDNPNSGNAIINIHDPSDSTDHKMLHGSSVSIGNAGGMNLQKFSGSNVGSAAWSNIRFYFSSGNISSGTISLFGVRKT